MSELNRQENTAPFHDLFVTSLWIEVFYCLVSSYTRSTIVHILLSISHVDLNFFYQKVISVIKSPHGQLCGNFMLLQT